MDENENRSRKVDNIEAVGTAQLGQDSPIACISIIGQIEGHMVLPEQSKSTKYEHILPLLVDIEQNEKVKGFLLVLNTVEEPERWSTYFLKIDDVKFRQKVVPGDTLLFKVDLLAPIRHGISSMKGYVFVGDHVVSEATFTAQIVKNK